MLRVVIAVLFFAGTLHTLADEPGPRDPAKGAEDFLPPEYMGRVVSVTAGAITVKPEGDVKHTYTRYGPNGVVTNKWEHVQDNSQPSRTFVFHGCVLKVSGMPTAYRGAVSFEGHRIGDVRPNDLVMIECRRFGGVDYCTDIVIHRRPEGRVPPALDTGVPEKDRRHVWLNAAQAREEKAVAGLQ